MTSYRDAWNSHRHRIETVWQMAELHSRLLSLGPPHLPLQNRDIARTGRLVLNECRSVLDSIIDYVEQYGTFLPQPALELLDAHLGLISEELKTTTHDDDPNTQTLAVKIPFRFKSVESDVSYLLSDIQAVMRTKSERSFLHLQRLISVDPVVRNAWCTAFSDGGETECEKRGAVHLLWHGIYAFKVNGAGARTDLVFSEPVDAGDPAVRSADGLILTEWKKATSQDTAHSQFEKARSQGKLYAHGILAANELRGYAYAIVVTEQTIQTPEDQEAGGLIWKHINIAVNPGTPSRTRLK